MNTDQQNRLEIMKALEKDFPDRLMEDLIDVARYVEGDASASAEEIKEFQRKIEEARMRLGLDPIHFKIPDAPRKWTNLDAIPSTVKAITDRDGDRAEPQTFQGNTTATRPWPVTAHRENLRSRATPGNDPGQSLVTLAAATCSVDSPWTPIVVFFGWSQAAIQLHVPVYLKTAHIGG